MEDSNEITAEPLDEVSTLQVRTARLENIRTEHEGCYKELQESEERFRLLFEQTPEASVLFDADTDRFVDANQKAEELFGCTREMLLSSDLKQFCVDRRLTGEPLDEDFRSRTEKVLSGEKVVFERMIGNSETRGLRCEVQLVRFPFTDRKLIHARFTDITGRKRNEEAIRRGEERLRRAQAMAHVGNWELDLRTKKIWASEEAFHIYGVDHEESEVPLELVQRTALPQYRSKLDLALAQLVKHGKEYDEEFEIRRQNDGRLRFVHSRAEVVLSEDGTPSMVVGVVQDVTDRKLAEGSLRESEEKYRMVAEQTHDGVYVHKDNRFIFANRRMTEITGYLREELSSMSIWKILHPDDMDYVMDIGGKRKRGEAAPSTYEARIVTKDGAVRHVELAVSAISYEGGYAALGAVRDITDRKEAESEMRAIANAIIDCTGEECLDRIAQSIAEWLGADCVIIAVIMPDEKRLSTLSMRLDGVTSKGQVYALEATPCRDVLSAGFSFYPEGIRMRFPQDENLCELNVEGYVGTPLRRPDGTVHGLLCALSRLPMRKVLRLQEIMGVLASKASVEIERMRAEEALQANLREKEVLLKEIHHRVKNNLQVMSSLLNMQSQHIHDSRDVDAFRASMDRIKSMALIHDKLYRSENLATIYLPDYVRDLAQGLLQTYGLGKGSELKIDVAPIIFDIDTAMHLGLIINELLSNSLKHAFRENMKGDIVVDIHKKGEEVEMLVSDNGVGFPADLDFMDTPSLGMQLVTTLVEQLEGAISLSRERGTAFRITFKHR